MKIFPFLLALPALMLPASTQNMYMDVPGIKEWVIRRVVTGKVVVFCRSHCYYCKTALGLLKEMIPYDLDVYMMEDLPAYIEIMRYFKKTTGAATLPRIYIGGKFFGGCDTLVKENESGMLRGLLEDAGCTIRTQEQIEENGKQ